MNAPSDPGGMISAAGLFDAAWYLAEYSDVAEAGIDPLLHYVGHGAGEGRQPNRYFMPRWYSARHPQAGAGIAALLHYAANRFAPRSLDGERGERPIADVLELLTPDDLRQIIGTSHLLEPAWYLEEYPDLAAAGADPLTHYITHGASELRKPNRMFLPEWYRSQHPEAGDGIALLIHYIEVGAARGYQTHPSYAPDMFPGLSSDGYSDRLTPLGAFLQALNVLQRSPLFQRDWYLQTYKDVAATASDPLWHYLLHGQAEGRNPNPMFDTLWYLAAHPEVAAAGANPLAHYILEGADRGYAPHPFFPPSNGDGPGTPLERFFRNTLPFDPGALSRFSPYDVHKATVAETRQRDAAGRIGHLAVMRRWPRFVVLIDGAADADHGATVVSLEHQSYPNHVVAADRADLMRLADAGEDAFLIWLDAGDILEPDALYEMAAALNAAPGCDLLYADDDCVTAAGRHVPRHKPGWSPDRLEASDYIGTAACFRWKSVVRHVDQAQDRYDLTLRMTEGRCLVVHIDHVLLTRPERRATLSPAEEAAQIRALEQRLRRTGRAGGVRPIETGAGFYHLDIAPTAAPLISIVIPTAARVVRYEGRQIDLIVQCLETVTEVSTYTNLEIVLIDNGDFDRDRIGHLTAIPITFTTYDLPDINIARKINQGVAHALGEVVLLLNDDTLPLARDWIERMLAHLEKPHVGIVGAKLLYPNRTIQHAGVVMCDGEPAHVRRGFNREDTGYQFSTAGVMNYLAVTGAVMMCRRQDFLDIGGFSEDLPIDYNDIDFCLKAIQAGKTVVYEPLAEVFHYESISFVRPPQVHDAARFARRWAALANDPYYNEYCLSKHPAEFELRYSVRKH